MLKKIALFCIAISIFGCKNEQKETESTVDQTEFKQEHNAKTALDYTGVYEGELPCADCEYILYKISIYEDMKFYAKYIYKGKSKEIFVEEGNYDWSESGNVIILKSEKQSTQFKVEENRIQMLSQDGKEIESSFSEKYYLQKVN
ncbi:copper resistance protein NlpE [Psychroflexus salis]|uniref:Lipoprotein n=1 Tax=Psychroflexus salis TaxID=1526574 RepID=A0A916ZRU9_9FLAO|nr:copper resistance protein NlpE [Psychroflexus salis]GGE11239.1 lipoprotein [Psychroflexus salis]